MTKHEFALHLLRSVRQPLIIGGVREKPAVCAHLVLLVMASDPARDWRPAVLARRAELEIGNIYAYAKGLERAGLISRAPTAVRHGPGEHRYTYRLTDAGADRVRLLLTPGRKEGA